MISARFAVSTVVAMLLLPLLTSFAQAQRCSTCGLPLPVRKSHAPPHGNEYGYCTTCERRQRESQAAEERRRAVSEERSRRAAAEERASELRDEREAEIRRQILNDAMQRAALRQNALAEVRRVEEARQARIEEERVESAKREKRFEELLGPAKSREQGGLGGDDLSLLGSSLDLGGYSGGGVLGLLGSASTVAESSDPYNEAAREFVKLGAGELVGLGCAAVLTPTPAAGAAPLAARVCSFLGGLVADAVIESGADRIAPKAESPSGIADEIEMICRVDGSSGVRDRSKFTDEESKVIDDALDALGIRPQTPAVLPPAAPTPAGATPTPRGATIGPAR